jgi:hypothetical protein
MHLVSASWVDCPHCGRRFSQQASERHLAVCERVRSKPGRVQRGAATLAYMRAQPRAFS